MRYVLRNQHKIEKAYDKKILDRINLSLKNHFDKTDKLDAVLCYGDANHTIMIDDAGHSFNMVAFYVISTVFDVVTLVFKEFIG